MFQRRKKKKDPQSSPRCPRCHCLLTRPHLAVCPRCLETLPQAYGCTGCGRCGVKTPE